jgi:hypothetical protein
MRKQARRAFIIAIFLVGILVASSMSSVTAGGPKECNDHIDNDGDGDIDLADAGCDDKKDNDETNCGDGVCEGGEDYGSCPADCMPPDSCSDTDGGFYIFVQGTVSGDSGGEPYSYTDYCVDSLILKEYYCSGASPTSWDISCESNSSTTCLNGACV